LAAQTRLTTRQQSHRSDLQRRDSCIVWILAVSALAHPPSRTPSARRTCRKDTRPGRPNSQHAIHDDTKYIRLHLKMRQSSCHTSHIPIPLLAYSAASFAVLILRLDVMMAYHNPQSHSQAISENPESCMALRITGTSPAYLYLAEPARDSGSACASRRLGGSLDPAPHVRFSLHCWPLGQGPAEDRLGFWSACRCFVLRCRSGGIVAGYIRPSKGKFGFLVKSEARNSRTGGTEGLRYIFHPAPERLSEISGAPHLPRCRDIP